MAGIKAKIALIAGASGRRLAEMIEDAGEPTVVADAARKAAGPAHRKLRYSVGGRAEPVAIASQILAWSHDGCRHSKGPAARRTDGITASRPGLGQVVNPKLDRPR